MKHLAILNEIIDTCRKDETVLGLAVFGSVANGTFHDKSDIDLYFIYKQFEKNYEFSTDFVHETKVGFSKWSYERFLERVKNNPYRMYVFAHSKILIDKADVKDRQNSLLQYFASHPDVQREWDSFNKAYENEKKLYGQGKTSIFDVYEKLEEKFGI